MESVERERCGWIRSIRQSKKIAFYAVTDGQEDFQLTVKIETPIIGEPKIGASFRAMGLDSITPRGSYEFLVSKLEIVGQSDDDFPIQPKEHSPEFLRSIPHLRGRTAQMQAVWRIRHAATMAMHQILTDKGFIQYYAPLITSADCEGAGETFKVASDWMESHLTVSAQLHGEVGMMACGKIYTLGPCFRAEKSSGRRHLSEFWMLEPEMAFYDLEQTMSLVEEIVIQALGMSMLPKEFEKMRTDFEHVHALLQLPPGGHWPRVTYMEAMARLEKTWGVDLSAEDERRLVQIWGGPVFVTHWPKSLKPFYMKTEGDVALCFDLIWPEVGELVGGSVREEDYEKLKSAMVAQGLDPQSMDWYLQTRKWGTVPHAGFGLGVERLIMFICKLEKIHDTIPFPVHY